MIYDLDLLTALALVVAQAMPAVTVREFLWEMPYTLAGFLVVQALRMRGVKGIGRPEKSDKLWAAWITKTKHSTKGTTR